MFAKAYSIASEFTHPVIVSYRYWDGTVSSGLGSFVTINKEGWFITAAHILDPLLMHFQHLKEIGNYKLEVDLIENSQFLSSNAKARKKSKIKANKKWITNVSLWWGADRHLVKDFKVLKENDIAIGKFENYDPSFCNRYPTFKEPSSLNHGTSLCKLGYPFYDVKTTFDLNSNSFMLDTSVLPIPRFPIDGIFTRDIICTGFTSSPKYTIKFIETSTPGLKGQSGGPTFDVDGRIWAIQSQTQHLSLGFSPAVKINGKEIQENQFINVGWGAHVETILKFLGDKIK
jgi:hypothetical protein